jgi:hypothetical protein
MPYNLVRQNRDATGNSPSQSVDKHVQVDDRMNALIERLGDAVGRTLAEKELSQAHRWDIVES